MKISMSGDPDHTGMLEGYCKKDIRSRITWAKNMFSNRKELLTIAFGFDLKS